MATRAPDIVEKLGYAQLRLHELQKEVREAQATDKRIPYVGQRVGEILGACRECFDYAIRDIVESIVPGFKERFYFPFSVESLKREPFVTLETAAPDVFAFMSDGAKKIEHNTPWPGTIFGHSILREVNELVNAKKHDRITVASRHDNSATKVDFPGRSSILVSPVFRFDEAVPDFGEDVDAEPMLGNQPEVKVSYVYEYRLSENNWEISRYCHHAIELTWRLLESLYSVAGLSRNISTFSPHETLKSPEQKEFEALLVRSQHIVTRLINIGFHLQGVSVKLIELEFDGTLKSSGNPDDEYLSTLFTDVFDMYGWPSVARPKIEPVIRENLVRIEASGFGPQYCEIKIEKDRLLSLPSGAQLKFDTMVWGLGTKFRQAEPQSSSVQPISRERWYRVALVFPNSQFLTAVGTRPLGS